MYMLPATQRAVPGTTLPSGSVSCTVVTSRRVESMSLVSTSESIVFTAHAHG
jgi:hypothetical protein